MSKITSNKILSLLLAVVMILTMIPLTAAAEANGCTHDCAEVTCGYIGCDGTFSNNTGIAMTANTTTPIVYPAPTPTVTTEADLITALESAKLAVNTTIDGYEVGGDGARKEM